VLKGFFMIPFYSLPYSEVLQIVKDYLIYKKQRTRGHLLSVSYRDFSRWVELCSRYSRKIEVKRIPVNKTLFLEALDDIHKDLGLRRIEELESRYNLVFERVDWDGEVEK